MRFRSADPTVFGSFLTLATYVFVDWLRVSIHGTSFSLLFSKLPKLSVYGLALVLSQWLWLGLPFTFTMFFPSLLHSRCALL